MSPTRIDTSALELSSGLKAARSWLKARNFAELSLASERGEGIYGIRLSGSSNSEARIQVVTTLTIATSRARDTMYLVLEWKRECPAERLALLFVPAAFLENAREILGMYDEYVAY